MNRSDNNAPILKLLDWKFPEFSNCFIGHSLGSVSSLTGYSLNTPAFPSKKKWLRLDRSTARYIYKAKNGKLLVVLTPLQKAKLIFEQYIKTLFNKRSF